VDKVIVEPIKNSPAALRPTLSKMAFILLVNMNGKTGMIGPMARVWIPAFFPEKFANEKLRKAKLYRYQTTTALKDQRLLSFMTKRLVTPYDENEP